MSNVTDEQRAKFEAWAKNGFELHRNGGAEYSSMITQAAWAAWQAALALATPPAQEGVSRKRDGGSPRSIKHPPYAHPGDVA